MHLTGVDANRPNEPDRPMPYPIHIVSRNTGKRMQILPAPDDDMTDVLVKLYDDRPADLATYMLGISFEFEGRTVPIWRKASFVDIFSSQHNPVYVVDRNL